MNLKLEHFLSVLLFVGLMVASPIYALPSDNKQPIYVEADSASRDGKKEITIYRGNVIVNQGTLKLRASTVHIQTKNNKLVSIMATGSPAYLSQKPRADQDTVVARANKITYYVKQQKASLVGSASLKQEGREIKSDMISYDFGRKYVEAKNTTKTGRVKVVIPPASQER